MTAISYREGGRQKAGQSGQGSPGRQVLAERGAYCFSRWFTRATEALLRDTATTERVIARVVKKVAARDLGCSEGRKACTLCCC